MHTARMQTEPHAKPQQRRRAREIFLVLVVGIAVAVALAGVVEDAGTLPEGAFASVNGQALPLEQLDVLLARLGEQREVVQNVLANFTPDFASASMCGVLTCAEP